MTDKYEEFREHCLAIRASGEKSPRALQAYWTLEFMTEFDGLKRKKKKQ